MSTELPTGLSLIWVPILPGQLNVGIVEISGTVNTMDTPPVSRSSVREKDTVQVVQNATRSNSPRTKLQQRRFSKACAKMLDLRDEVMQERVALRERNAAMTEPRSRVQELHRVLWTAWEANWNTGQNPDGSVLTAVYEEMQGLLDKMGPLEEASAEKENDVHVAEYKLGRIERAVFQRSVTLNPGSLSEASSLVSDDLSDDQTSSLQTGLEVSADDELLQKYLSRLGDANIVRERIAYLKQERDEYLAQERDRKHLGIPLFQPNVDFLSSFGEVYEAHLRELRKLDDEVVELGAAAGVQNIQDHVFEERWPSLHGSPTSPGVPLRATWPQSFDHQESPTLQRRRSCGDLSNISLDDPTCRQRINTWMLEKLKVIKVEQTYHKSILNNPRLTHKQWWNLVLDYWKQDSETSESTSLPGASPPHEFPSRKRNTTLITVTDQHAEVPQSPPPENSYMPDLRPLLMDESSLRNLPTPQHSPSKDLILRLRYASRLKVKDENLFEAERPSDPPQEFGLPFTDSDSSQFGTGQSSSQMYTLRSTSSNNSRVDESDPFDNLSRPTLSLPKLEPQAATSLEMLSRETNPDAEQDKARSDSNEVSAGGRTMRNKQSIGEQSPYSLADTVKGVCYRENSDAFPTASVCSRVRSESKILEELESLRSHSPYDDTEWDFLRDITTSHSR